MFDRLEIGVVLVTYNRSEKLQIALDCFSNQTKLPSYIIVVDNASNDNTETYLNEWKKKDEGFCKYIIRHSENLGGSGGFYSGLQAASKLDANWIWVSDDDAFPEIDALEQASVFLEEHNENVSAICGAVINNGQYDLTHRKNYNQIGLNIVEYHFPETMYEKRYFDLTCFSYVGTIMNRESLIKSGFPNKEYFLWCDDTEHSLRMNKVGKILCVPAIRVHHDVGVSNDGFTWKTYYGFRNLADMYRRHFSRIVYEWFCLKMILKTILNDIKGKNKDENKAIRVAILDARHNKFGIHELYKPGWKPN